MIKNYLLITVRSMLKNKVFIVINVLGMGVAIAICIVGYFALQYDNQFDAIHESRGSIYRVSAVRDFNNTLTKFGQSPLALGYITANTTADISGSSRYAGSSSNLKLEDDIFPANISYVDPDFFKMFSFEFIDGNSSTIKDETSLLISREVAIRLFKDPKEAVGKSITQVIGKEVKELKITGVFKEPPMNSSFYKEQGSAYINFENYKDEYRGFRDDDWTVTGALFIQIKNPAVIARATRQLQAYTKNNNQVREDFQIKEFALDPFVTMAHDDRAGNVQVLTRSAPPQASIIGSVIMSVLILLIACFNLTNTAIAISARRLKEIGIRKVMGSLRIQLIAQFIGETTFICLLALIVGLGVADVLIAGWNVMTGNNIHLEPHYLEEPAFILFLVGVLICTGILAGSYPAFYISRFQPVSILKGKLSLGGTNYFTRTLLGLQFVISLISIVSAIAFLQNARYQQQYDLGFDARGSVIAWVDDRSEFETYRNALQSNPQITSIAGAKSGIFSNRLHQPVKFESQQAEVDIIEVGDHYLSTLDLKLIQGRDFIKDSETDKKESIIITQKMADLFGWANPIGKQITWKDSANLYVVGVIKDVHTQGLWRELEPMMIRYVGPDAYSQIIVSTTAENLSAVNIFMQDKWHDVFPKRLYNGYRLTTVLEQSSTLNMSIVSGYTFLGAIALMLSATGLYSLVSLNMIRRLKEIGIRKVVGASVSSITKTVNKEFIIILVIASVLGSWAGFTWCNTIMSTIWKYYQGVNLLTIVLAVCLMLIVAVSTIGYKVYTIASMNPVKTLRDE